MDPTSESHGHWIRPVGGDLVARVPTGTPGSHGYELFVKPPPDALFEFSDVISGRFGCVPSRIWTSSRPPAPSWTSYSDRTSPWWWQFAPIDEVVELHAVRPEMDAIADFRELPADPYTPHHDRTAPVWARDFDDAPDGPGHAPAPQHW